MEPKAYSYIRFSTPEQALGDSLRRQVQLAEEYARKHGLILDDTTMIDRGLSAFKGEHRTKGALGEFLRLVEAGTRLEFTIRLLENKEVKSDTLKMILEFGGLTGIGQWRKGGYGRFNQERRGKE